MHIVFNQRHRLSDDVLLTALVRDLHQTLTEAEIPVTLQVNTSFPEVWINNPYIDVKTITRGAVAINVDYAGYYRKAAAGMYDRHALLAMYEAASSQLDIPIPCRIPRPDIYLSTLEQYPRRVSGRYWLLAPSLKPTEASFLWPTASWQTLVNKLLAKEIGLVQVGRRDAVSQAPTLYGVLDRVNQTTFRELAAYVSQADGVVCYPGLLVHLAAAFEKPCVILAGGQSPRSWFTYAPGPAFGEVAEFVTPTQTCLQAIEDLPCCATLACGRFWLPDDTGDTSSPKCCERPVTTESGLILAECLERLDPEQAAQSVVAYTGGELEALPTVTAVRAVRPRILIPRKRKETLMDMVATPAGEDPLDQPLLGGKITVLVLAYGAYTELIQRCLTSIFETTRPEQIDLRVWANAVSPTTMTYLLSLGDQISKLYVETDKRKAVKYPAMRTMLRDPDHPITTPYFVWFDDDSYCLPGSRWLHELAKMIVRRHPEGYRLFGPLNRHPCKLARLQPLRRVWPPRSGAEIHQQNQKVKASLAWKWYETRPWYQGRPYRDLNETPSPNGNYTYFAHGAWWALHHETAIAADIPDETLWHNGGDITIGEQINQAGFRMADINKGEGLVRISANNRRGATSKFPWTLLEEQLRQEGK